MAASKTHQNDFEEHLLVDRHVLLIPLLNVGRLLSGIRIVIGRGWWVALVVLAPLENLAQDGLVDLRA